MNKNELDKRMEVLKRPIDFDALVQSGALIQKGKSYYLGLKDLIPEYVSNKIKTIEKNKNGMKVTFYK
jgi:hypothetical protein